MPLLLQGRGRLLMAVWLWALQGTVLVNVFLWSDQEMSGRREVVVNCSAMMASSLVIMALGSLSRLRRSRPQLASVAQGVIKVDAQGHVRVFNQRGDYRCRMEVSPRARPGVVNGLGIWWRKLGLDGTNVNELTSQRLTDLGRGPVFYDCLVQVAPLDAARA